MIKISLEILSICTVFAAYGLFHFCNDIFNYLSVEKWYMSVLVTVLMIVGFFVFKGVYGEWFTIV